jgi:hypothetical protein
MSAFSGRCRTTFLAGLVATTLATDFSPLTLAQRRHQINDVAG